MRKTDLVLCFLSILLSVALCSCGGSSSSGSSAQFQFDASPTYHGSLSISGTISLPGTIPANQAFSITLGKQGGNSTEDIIVRFYAISGSISYTISGLTTGQYNLGFYADMNHNSTVDTGDFYGFYPGTVSSPVTTAGAEQAYDLGTSSATGVDFGAGLQP